MFAFVIALFSALGFVGATHVASTGIGRSALVRRVAMLIAAGILLGVVLGDLVPEALEHTDPVRFALAVAGGFLLLYVVETVSGGHTHHHESHEPSAPAHAHGDCVPRHAIAPFLVGVGLHNLADGFVLGVGAVTSHMAAGIVAVGILVHQVPVGLSFAAVLHADGVRQRGALRDALVVGAMIPLGALIVLIGPAPSASTLGMMLAAAGGALLYVATGHLLPEAHSEHRSPWSAAVFAAAVSATILLVGSLVHG